MRTIFTASVVVLLSAAGFAAEVSPAEAKLRESLRATMLQLRTAQTEKAAVEAAKAEAEQKVAEISEQLDKLTKQATAEKEAADKRVAELIDRVVARGNEVMQLQSDLAASQKAHKEATALAAKKEGDRAKLQSEKIVLERKVAEQQAKNGAMFKLGNEILDRYAKFGLGTAITAREPFVGLTRVKFQNLIQDYGDKLADHKIKP
jgi:hypothetical protein